MLELLTMTYLITGNSKKNIREKILEILSKYWERELTLEVLDSAHPDVHILDGEGKSSLGIEDVKKLQSEMVFTPFEERVQTAIINEAQKLTVQAQNSILKTLEESSDTTLYILVVNNEKVLLPTILSRSRKIYTKDEKEVTKDIENIKRILDMELVDIFKYIEEISKEKSKVDDLLKDMELYFQSLLEERIREGEGYTEVAKNIEQISIAQKRIKANGNKKLVLENLLLHLTR